MGRLEKRENKENRNKNIKTIVRRLDFLREAKRKLGWVELEVPYQKGWKRTCKLREDILNREDAKFLQIALDIVNTETFCRNQDFKRKNFRTGVIEDIPHQFKPIYPNNISTLPQDIQIRFSKYFSPIFTTTRWGGEKMHYRLKMPDFYFVYDIIPNMITKERILDPEMESEIKEIENKINTIGGWNAICKALGQSKYNFYDDHEYEKKINKKFSFNIDQDLADLEYYSQEENYGK